MKATEIKAMRDALAAKIQESFRKMLESSSEEDVRAWESQHSLLDRLDDEMAKAEMAESKGMAEALRKPAAETLTESQRFCRKLTEAVSLGTTFSGQLPTEMAKQVQMKKESLARLRGIVTVHKATGSYTVMVQGDVAVVTYATEASDIDETSPSIAPIPLNALKAAALIKVSREYLADLAVDVMGYLTDELARAFARFEDEQILFGTGIHGTAGTAIRGIVPNVSANVVSAATTSFTWENVKDTIALLKGYQASSRIVLSQEALNEIGLFTDGSGNYIFPQNQRLTAIMGIPVVVSDAMTLASGYPVLVAGDFSYYHLMDRQGLEVMTLNELYAASDQVGIRAVERIDGDFSTEEAFAVLTVA